MYASVTEAPSSSGWNRKHNMYLIVLFAVILCPAVAVGEPKTAASQESTSDLDYIRAACNVTLYRGVCMASLSSSRGLLKGNQSRLVIAAVEISLVKNQNASAFISNLAKHNAGATRERAAMEDCVENIGDAVDWVQKSLYELQNLKPDTFSSQMNSVQTWLSAALTYQDTCLDGFDGVQGRLKDVVARRMQIVSKYTGNALGLVNDYAVKGVKELRV